MLKTIDKYLSYAENVINGTLILGGVIVLFWNIIMRAFHAASSWAEEAIRYSIIWVTFLGSSQCAKLGNHVGIDLVVQMMPEKVQRYFNALSQFIAAIFVAACVYAGWQAMDLVITTSQKSIAMQMPMWIVYICVPLGCALMAIRFVVAGIGFLLNKNSGSLLADEEGNIDLNKL